MSPPPPSGTKTLQVDEGPLDNDLLQSGRIRGRTIACHQVGTAVRPIDHALFNQRRDHSPSPLPTFHASELQNRPFTKRL